MLCENAVRAIAAVPAVEAVEADGCRSPPTVVDRCAGGGAGEGDQGASHGGRVVVGAQDRGDAELTQPPLALLVVAGDQRRDPDAVAGEVAQGVAVEPAQVG